MKKLSVVIIILLALIVLMVLRQSNKNIFHRNANDVIESVMNNANLISKNEIDGQYLFVCLDDKMPEFKINSSEILHLPLQQLLNEKNKGQLKKPALKIALYSSDMGTSSKAFTLLNQLGIQNIFVVKTDESADEIFRYEFHPDTSVAN